MESEGRLAYRKRKRSEVKVYSQCQVDDLLKEKQNGLDVQYSVLKEVYTKYELLKKENEVLKEKLAAYENPDDGYRSDWTWVKKIVFVLEKAGKPLRSAEIIELLEKRESTLRDHSSHVRLDTINERTSMNIRSRSPGRLTANQNAKTANTGRQWSSMTGLIAGSCSGLAHGCCLLIDFYQRSLNRQRAAGLDIH